RSFGRRARTAVPLFNGELSAGGVTGELLQEINRVVQAIERQRVELAAAALDAEHGPSGSHDEPVSGHTMDPVRLVGGDWEKPSVRVRGIGGGDEDRFRIGLAPEAFDRLRHGELDAGEAADEVA